MEVVEQVQSLLVLQMEAQASRPAVVRKAAQPPPTLVRGKEK
jgi:hypothetical protein